MISIDRLSKPVVVLPVYQPQLNALEWISLRRSTSVLRAHDFSVLAPRSRASSIKKLLCDRLDLASINLNFHLVEDRWLNSVASYNHLMLRGEFYDYYRSYSHVLIAQLDSYVFHDELNQWCARPWSYIGAPIYPAGAPYGKSNCQAIGVGGFSLRNVNDFRSAFSSNPRLSDSIDIREIAEAYNWKGKFFMWMKYLRFLLGGDCRLNQMKNSLFSRLGINEDVVYGKYLPRLFPWFLVPSYAEACQFSLDRYISEDLSVADKLPFGAHAWYRSEAVLGCWSSFIPELSELSR